MHCFMKYAYFERSYIDRKFQLFIFVKGLHYRIPKICAVACKKKFSYSRRKLRYVSWIRMFVHEYAISMHFLYRGYFQIFINSCVEKKYCKA